MTGNPIVSPMFDYNSSIHMEIFVHDQDRMKTLGDHAPWAAYTVFSLLDDGT